MASPSRENLQPYSNLEGGSKRNADVGQSKSKRRRNLLAGGVVAVLIIVAAVVGGVVASRNSKKGTSSSAGSNQGSTGASGGSIGMFATATNSFGVPVYPSATNVAAFAKPTFLAQAGSDPSRTWDKDTFQPASPAPTNVRPDRPRLIAPAFKWKQLPAFVASDPYLKKWNETIMADAQKWESMDPIPYEVDGGLNKSGVLDVARQVKRRIKVFAYAYRVTGQTKWVDRAWKELNNASGNGPTPFGETGNNWNTAHFLDVAEFTAAFAIGYDWLYEVWTDQQKQTIRTAIVNLGLRYGREAYANNAPYGWWQTAKGNWNCVCNGGLTLGALAVLGDDTSGIAPTILNYTVPNAAANCARGATSDGSWTETTNYWYFGTTSHAEMASALFTATGSSYGLMDSNPSFAATGFFHMYASGNQQLFDYGDHGPNKYSATANAMMLHATEFNLPEYMLFQRDRPDAAEPWTMFWYDPSVSGAFWNGLALDRYFEDPADAWASMRSSWTDVNGWYVAMKAGKHTGHASHGNLDAGDFVIDHAGVRWAGELGSGDYIAEGYFGPEAQDSPRYLYYRTRTEGQNTLVVDHQNQNINATAVTKFQSSNTRQDSSTVFTVPSDSTALFTADLTVNYDGTSIKRGIRFLNGRSRVLLQDDINASTKPIQWRMHTNATVAVSGSTATLTIDDKKMYVHILDPPANVAFEALPAQRYPDDPATPAGTQDQPNPGVTVLAINLLPGSYNLQVLFDPVGSGQDGVDYKPPAMVPIDQWTATSHG